MLRLPKVTIAALASIIILYCLASSTLRPDSQASHALHNAGGVFSSPFSSIFTRKPSLIGGPIILSPQLVGNQTYPRAIKLRSGALLGSFTVYGPKNSIQLVISPDGGNSWSPHGDLTLDPPSEYTVLDNGFLLELASGRVLCTFRAHTKEPEALNAEEKPGGQNEGFRYFRLLIYYSDDSGKTWEYLSTPTEEPGPVHGNWEPLLRFSNSGDLQFYYSREIGGGKDQDNLMRISKDEGVSWSDAKTVSGLDMETRDGMIGIQEIVPGSGHLMAVFETVEEKGDGVTFEGRFEVWSVTSRDDGNTWGERRMIYDSWYEDVEAKTLIKRNAGAPSIAMVGSTLLIGFMTDETKMEGMWHRNAYVKIISSDDGGKTWGNKLTVAEAPAAWAGLLALNDTNFLVLCEHEDRAEAHQLVLV